MTSAAPFFGLGLAAGVVQALLLRWAVRSGGTPLGGLLRFALPAGALAVAAVFGHLLEGAAGWASGFGCGVLLLIRRWS